MTTTDTERINDAMLSAIDYIIHIDELNRDQLEAIVHQKLVFAGVEYRDEVLREIIDAGEEKIGLVMEFLKRCLMLMRAEMQEYLSLELVNKAKRLSGIPDLDIEDTIPF